MEFEEEKKKPVAYFRADGYGEMMYRKNNTVDVRKEDYDFPKGWIKALYSEDYVKYLEENIKNLEREVEFADYEIANLNRTISNLEDDLYYSDLEISELEEQVRDIEKELSDING